MKMDEKLQLLLFLDKKEVLYDMKKECERFLQEIAEKTTQKFLPLRYTLQIDAMHVLEEFPDIGTLLLQEPMKFQDIGSDILYACVQAMVLDADNQIQPEQIAVKVRVTSLPRLLVCLNQHSYNGLVAFKGLLVAVTKPTSNVYHTVWTCPEECDGNEVILHYIPKNPPKCRVCRSIQFENSGMRRCGEQVTATFLLRNELFPKKFVVVDDLISKLKLGARYILVGVIVKKITTIWSIEEVSTLAAPLTISIPDDIAKLFKACNGIPFKFIYCLASSLGVNVCPLHCFMHLKISLLFSLVSIKAHFLTGSSILHVLASGADTSYVGNVMTAAASLAERNVFLGTTNTSVSTALIGSSGGVCVMPLPLHTYSQKQISSILSAIESNEISTDTGKIQLQSAVWAQGMDFRKVILMNVGNVFGFVCRGDYGESIDEIADFILQNAIEPPETMQEEIQALDNLKKYIDIVAGIKVTLSREAEILLRSYFLTARRERPRGVSVGSIGALVATSLTSARLCRRSIATTDDAVLAIWMHVSGSPEPRSAPAEYLQTPPDVKMFQKVITNFKEWLEQLLGNVVCVT